MFLKVPVIDLAEATTATIQHLSNFSYSFTWSRACRQVEAIAVEDQMQQTSSIFNSTTGIVSKQSAHEMRCSKNCRYLFRAPLFALIGQPIMQ